MRVLLSDASSLASRQTATILARQGHHVEALASSAICLGRFTRHLRRLHRVPSYGLDPLAWLQAAVEVVRGSGFDVLVPTQEQVAVLAARPAAMSGLGVAVAVPDFASLARLQDKLAGLETVRELELPHPPSEVVREPADLLALDRLPVFLKAPIGTASVGVVRVAAASELAAAAARFVEQGAFEDGGVLVQQPAEGPLVMVQAVFGRGRLLAHHANLRLREGAGGGASHKRSIVEPGIATHLRVLGGALGWHGALSLDAILTPGGPSYIDVNPRLVEPFNAWRAGVDLTGTLIRVARGQRVEPLGAGRSGVRTHQLLLALLGRAATGGGRAGVVRELAAAITGRGAYRGSEEELTPLRGDPLGAVAPGAVAAALLVNPRSWSWFAQGAPESYALTPAAWRRIRAFGGDDALS